MSSIWRDYGERHAAILGEADDLHFVRAGAGNTEESLICWEPILAAIMEGSPHPPPAGRASRSSTTSESVGTTASGS